MPLMYFLASVQCISLGGLIEDTWVGAESQGTSYIVYSLLIRHEMYYRMGCPRKKFNAVCVIVTDNIPCKFYNCKLHSKAQT